MKYNKMMQPIVLKDKEAIEAYQEAFKRSLSDGRAINAMREAKQKPPVVKGKPRN